MDPTRILVVEDEPISLHVLLENLAAEGYEAQGASTGAEAWEAILHAPAEFEVILLDRMMPDMDGIEILRRLKSRPNPAGTAVIIQTALSSEVEVLEGLREGAFYYLTKPFTAAALLAIVEAATRDRRVYRRMQLDLDQAARSMGCLTSGDFEFSTINEAWGLAKMLSKATPDPERCVGGLVELMLNAVEHGNLGITYEEKSRLLTEHHWQDEIERRLSLPEHCHKRASISFRRLDTEVQFLIRDEGAGFQWNTYLEVSPERAFHVHGRGIAMSRMLSFDTLEYLGSGNQVRVSLRT